MLALAVLGFLSCGWAKLLIRGSAGEFAMAFVFVLTVASGDVLLSKKLDLPVYVRPAIVIAIAGFSMLTLYALFS